MSRVITFSTKFPSYHPKKGQPTFFVEKIWKFIWDDYKGQSNPLQHYLEQYDKAFPCSLNDGENIHSHFPKSHTIRRGNRWKVGDKFSPRVWSGKPYNSKQIIIAPDIEIKKIWDVRINMSYEILDIGGCEYVYLMDKVLENLSLNDGLSVDDFLYWFGKKDFHGQIICWNENINY